MTEVGCLNVEDIADVLNLSDDDSRKKHAAECPRCRALVLSFEQFLEAEPIPGSNPADAGSRLSEFLKEQIEGGSKRAKTTRERSRFFDILQGRVQLRPALAVAVVLLAAAGLFWWQPWQPDPPRMLRSTPSDLESLDLHAPQFLDGGRVRLSWGTVADAESYQLRFFTSDLSEIARLEPVEGTTAVIDLEAIYPEGSPGSMLLWRVVALNNGDEINTSPPGFLELP